MGRRSSRVDERAEASGGTDPWGAARLQLFIGLPTLPHGGPTETCFEDSTLPKHWGYFYIFSQLRWFPLPQEKKEVEQEEEDLLLDRRSFFVSGFRSRAGGGVP